jgi:ribonucleotide monophosphatase NagD (HAD superfamily)
VRECPRFIIPPSTQSRLDPPQAGIAIADGVDVDSDARCDAAAFRRLAVEADVGAVVVACDEGFTYRKLAYASLCIQAGALFVATNADAADNIGGRLMPGTGAMLAAIQAATGCAPVVVAGKPSPWLLEVRNVANA